VVTAEQPTALEPILGNIPDELKERRQWVLWRYLPPKKAGDKWRKVPHTVSGHRASSTDPATWNTYAAVVDVYNVGNYDGIGYVFTSDDPFVGIDFDDSWDGEVFVPEISNWLQYLDSYAELSASGKGVHVIVRGDLPTDGFKRAKIEAYKARRFFAITGIVIDNISCRIEDRPEQVLDLYRKYAPAQQQQTSASVQSTVTFDDAKIIEKARNAKNGPKFLQLWEGNWKALGYPSQSEAEMALANMLRFWTQDKGQIDRLMRASGLARAKWDSKRGDDTYGSKTIGKSLASTRDVYASNDTDATVKIGSGKVVSSEPDDGDNYSDNSEDGEIIPEPRYILHRFREAFLPQPPVEWVVDQLFQRGSVNLVYGAPGSKKTYIMLDCAVCVAGHEVWLRRETYGGPVLLIDEESGPRRLNRRLAEVGRGHRASADLPISYTTLAMFNLLSCPADVQHLDVLFGQEQPVLVVIDALADVMVGGDENEVKDTHPVLQKLKGLAHKHNCAVVVIHHSNRQGKYRGSSAIPGVVDVMLSVDSPNGVSNITFVTEKNRDGEMQQFGAQIIFDKPMEAVRLLASEPVERIARERTSVAYVLEYLKARSNGAYLDDIIAKPDSCSPNAARLAVYELVKRGILIRTDSGGRGSRAYYELSSQDV